MKRFFAVSSIWFILACSVLCQKLTGQTLSSGSANSVSLKYTGTGGYSLVERTNLRRYVNGKYVGLTSREVRSFVSPSLPPSKKFKAKGSMFEHDQWYDGSFYVMEETLRNNQAAAAGVHEAIQSVFHISPNGQLTMHKDNGYPSYRSFPAYGANFVKTGDSWQAMAERSVDPMNKGIFTRMPMLVMYTFAGSEVYKGKDVYRIKAIWQTSYGPSEYDVRGDASLKKAAGGHKADIIILKSTCEPILVIDNTDETFVYSDGTQINFKGTITLFTEFPPAVDTEKIVTALNRVATVAPQAGTSGSGAVSGGTAGVVSGVGGSGSAAIAGAAGTYKNNVLVEKTPAGIRLSVRDIKFKPDSDQVVESEKTRLDELAKVLAMAPQSKFLIEGHTASVGRPEGEKKLSIERAKRIAQELAERGITGDRFICRGWGGTKPVAGNDTDEGRAQNRRVEITILE